MKVKIGWSHIINGTLIILYWIAIEDGFDLLITNYSNKYKKKKEDVQFVIYSSMLIISLLLLYWMNSFSILVC